MSEQEAAVMVNTSHAEAKQLLWGAAQIKSNTEG